MATRTITTTAAEDEAIAFAHAQSQKPPATIAPPPIVAIAPPPLPTTAPPGETEAEFFDRMTRYATVGPMVSRHHAAKNSDLLVAFASIPVENQEAARKAIEGVVADSGGTVPLHEAAWLWSTNTAPPPRANSVELDVSQANVATVTKTFFHYLDADNTNRMSALLAVPSGTLIRIAETANAANFVEVATTGAGVQRQGPDGHVEFPVAYRQHAGAWADLAPMTAVFT